MPHYLILAQSKITANTLGAWLELLGEKPLTDDDSRRMVWPDAIDHTTAIHAYETLSEWIENAARAGADAIPLNRVTVLVDSVNLAELDAVSEGGGWDSLIALLVLSFPEIRWLFGVMTVVEKSGSEAGIFDEERRIIKGHSLSSLLSGPRRDPLFDPTGLRDWIRRKTNCQLAHTIKDDLRLPERNKLAASIDEEKSYARFHGYVAYRFGYRADVITTWGLMKDRFGEETESFPRENETGPSPAENSEKIRKESHGYWLLLEDMSLNFPDKENKIHLLHLARCHPESKDEKQAGRAFHCPRLDSENPDIEDSQHRILITTGQTSRRDNSALRENRVYLRNKKNRRGKVVLKLTSGLFDLWQRCGLLRKRPKSKRLGNAPGFQWPPSSLPHSQETGEELGHGAQGLLLLVIDKLVERARVLTDKIATVGDAVLGAVLATDALELTGGKNLTTAIEALSLKHRFEVLAECQFSGVEHHIGIKPRMEEIALETEAISQWFGKKAALNAQMHILNELVRLLREHNQFDEEQICMRRVRTLHTTLWMRTQPWRYMFWPFIRYVEQLLASFPRFLSIVTVWLLVLAVLFAWALPQEVVGSGGILERIVLGLESAITSFFSVGSPIYHDTGAHTTTTLPTGPMVFVSSLAIVSGFLHLGVLITHLYTLVSRR
uniref:Uncharacterized protein n=1 Tax=Candidatus Kentrum sp. FM TaxID=2126340 RepID=A0A450S6Y2_9GAMM|nr:MAG: hypothetical protein BECKFM1743A_GA0114220_100447 [Candidatus Kentron sp. FM]VFJ47636.1 MAG: hypothetical protein BECKFM1743C_GA0114222_100486 [Candidatus Kentron sp. FM]VFK07650.1 MAG: hypothetical protein BECKFM1743B_GA0114221_100476 [Candidatus Kentron sp. FM]